MGLFTSNCKKCYAEITWFLEAPKDYHCKACGEYNSPEEISESMMVNWLTYQEVMSHFHELTLEEVRERYKDNPVATVMLSRTYWVGPK